MFDTPILEVAIGLIFIFSLLSILVTQINTIIVNMLNLRAKNLKEGLVYLVTDETIKAKLLSHPLIRMVPDTVQPHDTVSAQQAQQIVEQDPTKVTYIPPGTFVEALISLLTSDSDYSIYRPLIDGINALPDPEDRAKLRELLRSFRSFAETDTNALREAILALENKHHAELLSFALEEVENALGRLPAKTGQMIPLLEGIRKIENPVFQSAVQTVLTTAQSLDDARGKLEAWFDDGMNRASDLYRRRLQWLSLAIGLGLALVINVDSLYIVRAFWDSPELRRQVVQTAQGSLESLQTQLQGTAPDTQTQPETPPAAQDEGTADAQAQVEQSLDEINATVQNLLQLQLPLGWEYIPVNEQMILTSQAAGLPNPLENMRNLWNLLPTGQNPNWATLLLQKVIGLAVTMIAVAQGAPFWFDLLRKLTTRG